MLYHPACLRVGCLSLLQRQICFTWPQEHALSHWDTLSFWQPVHPQPSPQDPTLSRLCGRRQSTFRVLSGLKEFLTWDTALGNLCFFVQSPFGFASAHSERIWEILIPAPHFQSWKCKSCNSKHPNTITGIALELHWYWYKEAGTGSQEQDQGRRGEKRTTVAPSSLPFVADKKTPSESAGI